MTKQPDPDRRFVETRKQTGYVSRSKAQPETYRALGFRCGLEIHQQLLTEKKLFCRCPAGQYQQDGEYDAEIIRHMRPTLSEMGEYDGTALMEFKTRKRIVYHIKNETACTYDIDDTPPFPINRQALERAMEVALLLKTKIVGELHVTRKQYLDGSIPTGFQRTAIVGIDGEIPLAGRTVSIRQISIEEDSCREVSDVGHDRIYTTDRLGIPLIETVTAPELLSPDQAEEAGHYLRFLARSTGHVRVGIGAARQDVNVSIEGGTRVEIKGVAHLRWIPELTHNEAFRQKALLLIRDRIRKRHKDSETWTMTCTDLDSNQLKNRSDTWKSIQSEGFCFTAVNLPSFGGILSHFMQPGKNFSDELSGRLKVIACLQDPCMTHSEAVCSWLNAEDWASIQKILHAASGDAQVVFWGPLEDRKTALETLEERCRLAFEGVPGETRKSLPNGTTVFERVLPGPDRMYPDTDTAPIPITEVLIEKVEKQIPEDFSGRLKQLEVWGVPRHFLPYILRGNLSALIEQLVNRGMSPGLAGRLVGQDCRHLERKYGKPDGLHEFLIQLFQFILDRNLTHEIILEMLPWIFRHPGKEAAEVYAAGGFHEQHREEILAQIPRFRLAFEESGINHEPAARNRWIMGQLRPLAMGNIPMRELRQTLEGSRT
ncbi:MAG TPA: Glu-tRNA(Gln) amidotransferase subunit GatE [bacterium]|nr:Glu-tRNA(Gln) amidotransferase subunit GatE [bacterium]